MEEVFPKSKLANLFGLYVAAIMSEEKNRILVIDDDKGILRVFKNILEKDGYKVQTAETGREALEKEEHFDGKTTE